MATALALDPLEVAHKLFPDQPRGFPFDGFDVEELILPDGDDMGIASDDDDVEEEELESATGFGSVIVVANLPVVPDEKHGKLCKVLDKVFRQAGSIREGGLYMPKDAETKMSKGFAFIEYSTPQEAQTAREHLHGKELDRNHKFHVSAFDDFERYARVPNEYVPPEVKDYAPTENLNSWMMDRKARDQFVIRNADDTAVLWNDGKRHRCEEAYKRTFWTESFVQWSPQGNLLATIHRQGIAVWGGPSFLRLARFSHPAVQLIDFSPNEKFLLAYSSVEPRNARESTQVNLAIFDTRTGRKLRVFDGPAEEYAVGAAAGPGGALRWPFFKWAGGREDNYIARLGKGVISIYEAPDMVLLDKKSMKVDNVHDFEWSPAEPLLCTYMREEGNQPARVALIRIPSRVEVRQKNLFNVSDLQMFWHPQGDYLAVKVDRFTKTKKSTYTGFELFSIRERDIPMEVLELPNKSDKIVALAWEPRGHRFAVVHGDGARPAVSFYAMKDDKGRLGVRHVGTVTNKACNQVHWSPTGRNIVLAGLKGLNGQLEWFNVDEFETMAAAEHFMATDVEWDPTGRYVATAVTSIHQMENGFNMWSFNGKLLYTLARDRFFQFSWRPRMPSLLPPEKEAEIAKNLKAYSKRYDEEDEALVMQADADVLQERQRMVDEWRAWVESRQEYAAKIREFVTSVYGPAAVEREYEMESAVVEQVLDTREEPYNAAG